MVASRKHFHPCKFRTRKYRLRTEVLESRYLLDGVGLEPPDPPSPQPECTLRAAMMEANARPGPHAITFLVVSDFNGHFVVNSERDLPDVAPGDGVCWTGVNIFPVVPHVITVQSPLPVVVDPLIIHSDPWAAGRRDFAVEVRNAPGLHSDIVFNVPASNPHYHLPNSVNGLILSNMSIDILSHRTFVGGNYIGVTRSGTAGGQLGPGVRINSNENIVGVGVATNNVWPVPVYLHAYNVISGNSLHGVHIQSGQNNYVASNLIGLDPLGETALPNHQHGVLIDIAAGANFVQPIAGDLNACIISIGHPLHSCQHVISGNGMANGYGDGVLVQGPGKTGSRISNFIVGADVRGNLGIPNRRNGIRIDAGSSGVEIADNQIAGNLGNGVHLHGSGTQANWLHGNRIGNVANQNVTLRNQLAGVLMDGGTQANVVGLKPRDQQVRGSGNTISGNGTYGVQIAGSGSDNHVINGNRIGVHIHLAEAAPNALDGVYLGGVASQILIGVGEAPSPSSPPNTIPIELQVERNQISGNLRHGVFLDTSVSSNYIRGNFIGVATDSRIPPSGVLARVANGQDGVRILGEGNNVGTNGNGLWDAGEKNVIAGNLASGVVLEGIKAQFNKIAGNDIGFAGMGNGTADAQGNVPFGYGIWITGGANSNLIGTDGDLVSDDLEANVIQGNLGSGIRLEDTPSTLDTGIVGGVSSKEWTTVTLGRDYGSQMVVVATPNYDRNLPPLVTRIRNAVGNSFEIRVQRVDSSTESVTGITVHYLVVREGVYSGTIKMEAVKYASTVTDHTASWIGERRSYLQGYTAPVVLGQVMTENDAKFSTFWAHGPTAVVPPDPATLWVGKHVAEELPANRTRATETVGYIVLETAPDWFLDGRLIQAAVGPATLRGIDLVPRAYNPGLPRPTSVALLAAAGMQDTDGAWPVLYGQHPVAKDQVEIVMDEDQIGDSERSLSTTQVSRVAYATIWSLEQDNRMSGNLIGGHGQAQNMKFGIDVEHANRNWIGTHDFSNLGAPNPEGNRLHGNGLDNIRVGNSRNIIIRGNEISGSPPVGDAIERNGVLVDPGSADIQIGVTSEVSTVPDPYMANEIFDNHGHGIRIQGALNNGSTYGIHVSGNRIGVGLPGRPGNRDNGIVVSDWVASVAIGVVGNNSATSIGSTKSRVLQGNVISSNGPMSGSSQAVGHGVVIQGPRIGDTTVRGNKIGINAEATHPLPNFVDGIQLRDGVQRVVIGTNGDGRSDVLEGNIVAGNRRHGVNLVSEVGMPVTSENIIAGNDIGWSVPSNGSFIANSWSGVYIDQSNLNRIGGLQSADGNRIVANGDPEIVLPPPPLQSNAGVAVWSGVSNSILRNSIRLNVRLGIDLHHNGWGVTPNDLGDADTGANDLQNYPVITSITVASGGLRIAGTLNSRPSATYRIEFFDNAVDGCDGSGHGEGQTFLTSRTVTTNSSENASFVVFVPGARTVTTTATQLLAGRYLGTSEFSACRSAPAPRGSGPSGVGRADLLPRQLPVESWSRRVEATWESSVLCGSRMASKGPCPETMFVASRRDHFPIDLVRRTSNTEQLSAPWPDLLFAELSPAPCDDWLAATSSVRPAW